MQRSKLRKLLLSCILLSVILLLNFHNLLAVECSKQEITVKQVIDSTTYYGQQGAIFTYKWEAISPNAPMPTNSLNGIYEFTLQGDQSVNICLNNLTSGYYKYKLSSQGNTRDYLVQEKYYLVTLSVMEVNGQFYARIFQIKGEDDYKHDKIIFHWKYIAKNPEIPQNDDNIASLPKVIKQKLEKAIGKTGEILRSNYAIYFILCLILLLILLSLYLRQQSKEDNSKLSQEQEVEKNSTVNSLVTEEKAVSNNKSTYKLRSLRRRQRKYTPISGVYRRRITPKKYK